MTWSKPLTEDEVDFIRATYEQLGPTECSKRLGRSISVVKSRAKEMGLTGEMFAISVAMPAEVSDYLINGTLKSVALWDASVTARVQLNAAMKLFAGETIEEGSDLGEEGYNAIHIADNGKGKNYIYGDGYLAVTVDNWESFGF